MHTSTYFSKHLLGLAPNLKMIERQAMLAYIQGEEVGKTED